MTGDSWPRLAGAAAAARDDLRILAAELHNVIATDPVPHPLLTRAYKVAVQHANGLRSGLKHPSGGRARRKDHENNLPCWSPPQ